MLSIITIRELSGATTGRTIRESSGATTNRKSILALFCFLLPPTLTLNAQARSGGHSPTITGTLSTNTVSQNGSSCRWNRITTNATNNILTLAGGGLRQPDATRRRSSLADISAHTSGHYSWFFLSASAFGHVNLP